MTRTTIFSLLHLAILVGSSPTHACAQGNFVNFEVPVAKGLAIAQPSSGGTFVLACNADDNAVVILDAATNVVVARVPVGQAPVSAVYDASTSRIYTANYLGDSISAIQFPVPGSNPPAASLVTTTWVGDAPTDLLVDVVSGTLIVVCSGSNEITALDTSTFASAGRETLHVTSGSNITVMQMPWRILQRPLVGGVAPFVVLNQRSGTHRSSVFFTLMASVGLDLLEYVPGTGTTVSVPAVPFSVGGVPPLTMGTSNMGMALAPDGRLFVVGNDARNDLVGEPTLSAHPVGFVESWLWVADAPPNQNTINGRNLNLMGSTVMSPSSSASMPTDIVLRTSGATVQNVYVTSFSTDRIVQLNATTGAPSTWKRKVWNVSPRAGYSMVGPRSLATVTVGGVEKLFALTRLDASIKVWTISSSGDLSVTPTSVALNDPMPKQFRPGQTLLYDARRSGTGKVSCASCHIDGRTDSLAWELDTGTNPPNAIPPALIDGITGANPGITHWPANRGPMITQTLQGLRPHPIEVAGADLKPLLTTEPFYWRGARANFEAFGGAFTNLLGGATATPDEMKAFREFAFTIMYPPNPEQPVTRRFTGSIGTSGVVTDGSGSLRGMKLYHERSLVSSTNPGTQQPLGVVGAGDLTGGRSCVQCHALPTGTNSRIVETRGVPALDQPIKAAQLRGLRQREAVYAPFSPFGTNPFSYASGSSVGFFPVNSDGLFHDGFASNVNNLIHGQFTPFIGTSPDGTGDDVTAFVRQLDTGVAPIVGIPLSVTASGLGPATDGVVRLGEEQCEEGNAGLVVRRRIGGTTVNLFYNVLRQLYTDPANPNSTTVVFRGPFSSASAPPILPASMAAGDLIVFEAVPVGSERRIASSSGILTIQANTAPTVLSSSTSLTGFVAPPMWQPILTLQANVTVANWAGAGVGPKTSLAATAFHNALVAAGGFGVTNPRHHEAPRRIRVHGSNIQLGAKLDLKLPTGWAGSPPAPTGFITATFDLNPVLVPGLPAGEVVFETSATIDPLTAATIMCGWTAAPGVQTALDTGTPSAPLDPANHNVVVLQVRNESVGPPASTAVTTALRLK